MTQVVVGQMTAHVAEHVLELHAFALQAPLQGALADAQRFRHRFHVASAPPQVLGDQGAHPGNHGVAAQQTEAGLGKALVNHRQRVIGRAQRRQQLLRVEQEAGLGRAETQRAIEQALVLGNVLRLGIVELDGQRLRQIAAGQPAAEAQQCGGTSILTLPRHGHIGLRAFHDGQTLAARFRREKDGETVAQQRHEVNQALQRFLQVGAGHHHVAHQLETAGHEMRVNLQSDIRIARFDGRQLQQPIDDLAPETGIGLLQLFHIQAGFAAQPNHVQPFGQERVDQKLGKTGAYPVHGHSR